MLKFIQSLFSKSQNESTSKDAPSSAEVGPKPQAWIGVDLDGTLAEYNGWKGINHIGKPVPLMSKRVNEWLEKGYNIKIFTARAGSREGILHVKAWLKSNGFPDLEVTNMKDFNMIESWDDRAIQVIENTGKAVLSSRLSGKPQAPLLDDESTGENSVIAKRAR